MIRKSNNWLKSEGLQMVGLMNCRAETVEHSGPSSLLSNTTSRVTTRTNLPGVVETFTSSRMLERVGETCSSVPGMLAKASEPELSFVVREAVSNAGQQGVEETMEQVRPQVAMAVAATHSSSVHSAVPTP